MLVVNEKESCWSSTVKERVLSNSSAVEQKIKGGDSVGVRVFVRACLGAVLQRHCLLVVL